MRQRREFGPSMRRRDVLAGAAAVSAVAGSGAWAQAQTKPVVIALDHEPDTMDPMSSIAQPTLRPTIQNVFEPLVGIDHNGKIKSTISTWSFLDDGKIIEFKLRPNVKFHSGDLLKAEDIIFSHQRGWAKSASYRGYWRGLDRVEAVDDLTVRFIFTKPNIASLTARSLYAESKAYHDRVGEKEFVDKPAGTGPYRLIEFKPSQYVDLEAFDDYWGDKPQIRRARFVFVKDDSTRVAMLQAGEADVNFSTPWIQVEAMKKAGFNVVMAETHPTSAISFQLWNPDTPWAKLKVRQAIAHAVDTNAIIKGLFRGIPRHYALLSPGETGFDPDLKIYDFDPALAKKLLAEAGYPNGFTMPLYWPVGSYYGQKETAEAVALYLKAIGITVNVIAIDTIQNQAMLQKQSKDPNFVYVQMRSMPLANYGDPASAVALSLAKTGGNSVFKATDPAFDVLLDEATATLDEAKRSELLRRALRILYDEVGIITMWHAVNAYSMKPNFTFTPVEHMSATFDLVDLKMK